MIGNNETDRISAAGSVTAGHAGSQTNQAAGTLTGQTVTMGACEKARPMSDAQALPTRVAALMRAEAAVVQGAADLIGSAERNGMAVAVLVLGEGGAILHQLGTTLPDGAWPPNDPEAIALAALADEARVSRDPSARVAAANLLLGHAASQPKLSDPDGIGAMLNGLGYPRHVNGEKFTLAGRVRHALDLARANGADSERIRLQTAGPYVDTAGGTGTGTSQPVSADGQVEEIRDAVNGLFHCNEQDRTLITFSGKRVIVVGTPDQVRELVDQYEFSDESYVSATLRMALPGLRFGIERGDATWIALPNGQAIAYGKPDELRSMSTSEHAKIVAAEAERVLEIDVPAEVDAKADVTVTAELSVKKAQPRPPSHPVRADGYTSPFPHAFRRNRDNALCWAWMSPSRLGGTVCMVEHETGESSFINSAACLLSEYTQLTTG